MKVPYTCSLGQQIANEFTASRTVKTFDDVAFVIGIKSHNIETFVALCEQQQSNGLTPMQAMALYCAKRDRDDVIDAASVTYHAIPKYADSKHEFESAEAKYFGVTSKAIPQVVVTKVQQAYDDLVSRENAKLVEENKRLRDRVKGLETQIEVMTTALGRSYRGGAQ